MGGTALTIGGTPAIDANTYEVSYDWLTGEESSLLASLPRRNNRARWSFTVGAETIERVQYFDVVPVNIRTRVTDVELARLWPLIDNRRERVSGKATGGTTTTIIDTELLHSYAPNTWLGSSVQVLTGDAAGEERRVTLFDNEDATLTVFPALSGGPSSGHRYEIRASYLPQIRRAWSILSAEVVSWLGEERFARLLDGEDFTDAHTALSLALIGESLKDQAVNQFLDEATTQYRSDYEAAMRNAKVKFDDRVTITDEDGNLLDEQAGIGRIVCWSK
jgi:hypothetical protein